MPGPSTSSICSREEIPPACYEDTGFNTCWCLGYEVYHYFLLERVANVQKVQDNSRKFSFNSVIFSVIVRDPQLNMLASYACSFNSTLDGCSDLGTASTKVFFTLMVLFGLFVWAVSVFVFFKCGDLPIFRDQALKGNIATCGVVGAYRVVLAIKAYTYTSLSYITLDALKRFLNNIFSRAFISVPLQDIGTYRGLNNQGATCYLNATLQVLFMTKSFRDKVMRAPSDTNEKLVSALKEIFQELSNQDSGAPSDSTRGIITSLGIKNVYEQQDVVEFFLDILEKVDSTLAEDFSGTLRNIRKCSHHHVSYDDSPFKSLQIPVNPRDGQFKLDDGLNKYFESTMLDEDDQMYCDECEEKRDTTLSCEIHVYPEILPLHLKRFEYDYRVRRFVKNSCPMDVPLHLPLQLFQEHEYSLYAVINHTGTRSGGYYTAVIRSFTDDKWYRFNDSHVTVTDESELKGSGEALLLLYQKQTGSFDGSEPESPLPEPAAGPSTSAAVLTAPPGRAQRRVSEQPMEMERQLLEALRTHPVAPAPPPRSEDELFLLSLVPSLQRLPPQTKEFIKFQIHKLIYESSTVVLNLEQVEPTE